MTAKGELLRSIMFPKKVDFKFYRDTYYFVLALAAVSLIGMIYTLVFMVSECVILIMCYSSLSPECCAREVSKL